MTTTIQPIHEETYNGILVRVYQGDFYHKGVVRHCFTLNNVSYGTDYGTAKHALNRAHTMIDGWQKFLTPDR